jgi:hypothetical protein
MTQTAPIACTLSPADMPQRAADIRALARDALLSLEPRSAHRPPLPARPRHPRPRRGDRHRRVEVLRLHRLRTGRHRRRARAHARGAGPRRGRDEHARRPVRRRQVGGRRVSAQRTPAPRNLLGGGIGLLTVLCCLAPPAVIGAIGGSTVGGVPGVAGPSPSRSPPRTSCRRGAGQDEASAEQRGRAQTIETDASLGKEPSQPEQPVLPQWTSSGCPGRRAVRSWIAGQSGREPTGAPQAWSSSVAGAAGAPLGMRRGGCSCSTIALSTGPLGPLADGVLLSAVSARARIAALIASGLLLALPGRSSRAVGDAPNREELGSVARPRRARRT